MAEKEEVLLGQLAVKKGFISREELEEALTEQKRLETEASSKPLGEILIDLGLLTKKQAQKLLAEQRERAGAARRIGHFEVYAKLGEGGMGAVYLAKMMGPPVKGGDVRGFPDEPEEGPLVALKILPPKLAKDEHFLMRFRREVEVLSRLSHPNIVRAVDWGRADGLRYLAMEFVQGENSYQKVARDGPFEERDAVTLALEIAKALEYAHSKRIIHRDIKPENILIDLSAVTHLTDFGLVSRAEVEEDASLTSGGTTVGTPYYISPEQAQGVPELDIRSDLYSLGATLFHLLTGEVPYDGDNAPVIMTKHVVDPVPNPIKVRPRLSPNLAAVVMKLMAKSPRDRYHTPSELIEDLKRIWRGDPPIRARIPPTLKEKAAKRRRSSAVLRRSGTTRSRMLAATRGRSAIRSMQIYYTAAAFTAFVLVSTGAYLLHRFSTAGAPGVDISPPISSAPPAADHVTPPKTYDPITARPTTPQSIAYSIPLRNPSLVQNPIVPDPTGKNRRVAAAVPYRDYDGSTCLRFVAASDDRPLIPPVYPETPLRISYLARNTGRRVRVHTAVNVLGNRYSYTSPAHATIYPDGKWHDLEFPLRITGQIPGEPVNSITLSFPMTGERGEAYISSVEAAEPNVLGLGAPRSKPLLALAADDFSAGTGWQYFPGLWTAKTTGSFLDVPYTPPGDNRSLILAVFFIGDPGGQLLLYAPDDAQSKRERMTTPWDGKGVIKSVEISSRTSSTIRILARPAPGGSISIAKIVIYAAP